MVQGRLPSRWCDACDPTTDRFSSSSHGVRHGAETSLQQVLIGARAGLAGQVDRPCDQLMSPGGAEVLGYTLPVAQISKRDAGADQGRQRAAEARRLVEL